MKTTAVSSAALSNAMRTSQMRMQVELVKAQKEMDTGRVADVGLALGSRTAQSVTFQRDLDRLNGIVDSNALVSARLTSTQNALGQITAAGQQYDALRQSVNTQLTSTVSQINTYTAQIAQLNQQITAANSQGQPPNQLMDQRDLALSNLSSLAGVQVVRNDSGYSVFLAGGQPLVVADKSYQLATVASSSDPSELTVVSAAS